MLLFAIAKWEWSTTFYCTFMMFPLLLLAATRCAIGEKNHQKSFFLLDSLPSSLFLSPEYIWKQTGIKDGDLCASWQRPGLEGFDVCSRPPPLLCCSIWRSFRMMWHATCWSSLFSLEIAKNARVHSPPQIFHCYRSLLTYRPIA